MDSQIHDQAAGPSPQAVNPALVQFTRPASSHQDLATGFSFAKPKPAQSFNFSRKTTAISKAENDHLSGNSHNGSTDDIHAVQLNIEQQCNATALHEQSESEPTGPSLVENADINWVPFPNVVPPEKGESGLSITYSANGNGADADRMAEQSLKPTSDPPPRNPSLPQKSSRAVRKRVSHTNSSAEGIRNEDLLRLMMYRLHKDKQDQEELMKIQDMQTEKMQHLQGLNTTLKAELEEVNLKLSDKQNLLDEHHAQKQRSEQRIKRLKDFVNGLSNDHNRLRDEARRLRANQDGLLKEGQAIQRGIQELDSSMKTKVILAKNLASTACHQAEILEHKMDTLQTQLHDRQAALEYERLRNEKQEAVTSDSRVTIQGLSRLLQDNYGLVSL